MYLLYSLLVLISFPQESPIVTAPLELKPSRAYEGLTSAPKTLPPLSKKEYAELESKMFYDISIASSKCETSAVDSESSISSSANSSIGSPKWFIARSKLGYFVSNCNSLSNLIEDAILFYSKIMEDISYKDRSVAIERQIGLITQLKRIAAREDDKVTRFSLIN